MIRRVRQGRTRSAGRLLRARDDRARPNLAGTVTVQMTIRRDRRDRSTRDKRLADGAELSRCLEQRVASWHFHTTSGES